jgi:hypothetical protein
MALGQQGPPATAKQLAYLLALLQKEGYATFRDARRAYGLAQRQAGGKFSGKEASALIDHLVNGTVPEPGRKETDEALERLRTSQSTVLRGMQADLMAAELERRGWTVTPPE